MNLSNQAKIYLFFSARECTIKERINYLEARLLINSSKVETEDIIKLVILKTELEVLERTERELIEFYDNCIDDELP